MIFKKKGLLCLGSVIVATALMIGCCLMADYYVNAASYSDITSDSIEAKKDEVADAKKEQTNIKNNITNMNNLIADLKNKRNDLDDYIESIDKDMNGIQESINLLEKLIVEKENQIEVKKQELVEAQEQEAEQYVSMQKRIQYLYETGDSSYLEAILKADSFADMLNRAEYVEEIAAYDNQMLHNYILQRQYIALCRDSLEEEKITLNVSKDALGAQKQNLQSVRDEKAQALAAYEHDISLTAAQIKELEEDLKFQTDLIASLEKEITDEQKAILKEHGITLGYDGSGFANPAPSYVRISSPFGWRSDPFTGYKAYHNGIDMAAAEGTPIVAAFDGIVGEAGYNSSMGNYIYVEHGNGLRTIYLHASKLYVSKNDIVLKGDVIAAVGTTGRSTGPHLHFSVRLNGEYVDPTDYIKFN